MVEVHLIADIQPHSYWTDVSLQSSAGIKHAAYVAPPETIHTAEKCAHGCRSVVKACVNESALQSQKRLDRMASDVDFGTEFTMENAQSRALYRHRSSPCIRETFRERL